MSDFREFLGYAVIGLIAAEINGAPLMASVGSNTPFADAILDHPGIQLAEQGPWTVSSNDFMQMASLIADLVRRNSWEGVPRDPMFDFLWNLLSDETKSALEKERAKMGNPAVPYKPGIGPQELVADVNKLIQGKLIYNEQAFGALKPYLSGDTVKLLNRPVVADVSRLNRLLLEDAFPLDIRRRPKILYDAVARNYFFIDFAVKPTFTITRWLNATVSLYDKDGKKKWTADMGPSLAEEFKSWPYSRNPGTPASRNNVGLWDVSPRSDMILVRIGGGHKCSINVNTGEVLRLPGW